MSTLAPALRRLEAPPEHARREDHANVQVRPRRRATPLQQTPHPHNPRALTTPATVTLLALSRADHPCARRRVPHRAVAAHSLAAAAAPKPTSPPPGRGQPVVAALRLHLTVAALRGGRLRRLARGRDDAARRRAGAPRRLRRVLRGRRARRRAPRRAQGDAAPARARGLALVAPSVRTWPPWARNGSPHAHNERAHGRQDKAMRGATAVIQAAGAATSWPSARQRSQTKVGGSDQPH